MHLTYYQILSVCYGLALFLWWFASTKFHSRLGHESGQHIKKAWLKTSIVFLCSIFTILIGRLYSAGLLLPSLDWISIPLIESINQLLIYSPFLLFFVFSNDNQAAAWIPKQNWVYRLFVGCMIASITISVFIILAGTRPMGAVFLDVWNFKNLHYLTQVFFEDFAISLFLARLSTALGKKYFLIAILAVAILFPLGHLPSNLEAGVPLTKAFLNLLIDCLLVFGVGFMLYREKDFLWFFPIHFAMDMMQFYSGLVIE